MRLVVPSSLIAACAALAFAQEPGLGSGEEAPPAPAPAAPVAPVMVDVLKFQETLEPPVEGAPAGADLLARAVAGMGGEAWDDVQGLACDFKTYRWQSKRLASLLRFELQARLSAPVAGKLQHFPFDAERMRRSPGMTFVVNGDDAFMLDRIDVLASAVHEEKAQAMVNHHLFVLAAPILLQRAGAAALYEGRCTVAGHEPKRYVPPAADPEVDLGYLDYQPLERKWLQVRVQVPAALQTALGPEALLWFDGEDGRLVRYRCQAKAEAELFREAPATFEIESWQPHALPDGREILLPSRVHVLRDDAAERMESIHVQNVRLNPEFDERTFRRP